MAPDMTIYRSFFESVERQEDTADLQRRQVQCDRLG